MEKHKGIQLKWNVNPNQPVVKISPQVGPSGYREHIAHYAGRQYIDCVYEGYDPAVRAWMEHDKAVYSIRTAHPDDSPVIKATFNGVEVAGYQRVFYADKMVEEFIANTLIERAEQKHNIRNPFNEFYDSLSDSANRIKDDLELMYPTAIEPLKIKGHHPEWVWDAVEQLFPKYALANRPQPTVKRPYVNVGTIGHIAYPTISVKPRSFKNFLH